METDRLSLDELLACYEEGTRLVKACDDFLSAAEQRIELITRDAEGTPRPIPFDPAASAETSAPASAPAPGEDSARPSHEVSLF